MLITMGIIIIIYLLYKRGGEGDDTQKRYYVGAGIFWGNVGHLIKIRPVLMKF